MLDQTFLQTIGTVVAAAACVSLFARRLQVPPIVSYLFVGLLLGPVLGILPLDHIADSTAASDLELTAELGIVLLLFLVGMELSLSQIRDVGKVAVAAGIGQVVFTAAGGFVIGWLLGFSPIHALFLATALTFSSTVVVVKVLDQKRALNSLFGRIAIGIFLVQDVVVILVLTILAGLGKAGEMTASSISLGMVRAIIGVVLLLAVAMLLSRFVLPHLFRWISRTPRAMVVMSLAWCFGLVLFSDTMGLSKEIGAFVAGLSLASLPTSTDLRRRLHPLMSFFVAVFFVTLGSQMRFDDAAEHWVAAVVMSLFVLIGNPLIFMIIITRFGYTERTSFFTSVTVAQISEFSFIFAAAGLAMGLIDASILSLIAVIGVVTIIVSVYMIMYCEWLYDKLHAWGILRVFRVPDREEPEMPDRHKAWLDHIVVVGMNSLGRLLAHELHDAGYTVVAIDNDPRKLSDLPCETLIGDIEYPATLEDAHLDQARLAICTLRIEDLSRLLIHRCHVLQVPVVVHGFDREVTPALESLKPTYIMDSKLAAERPTIEALRAAGVPLP